MSRTLTVFLICFMALQVSSLRVTHTEVAVPLTIEAESIPDAADALENADKSATELKILIARSPKHENQSDK